MTCEFGGEPVIGNLSKKVAVVTGSSRGLRKGIEFGLGEAWGDRVRHLPIDERVVSLWDDLMDVGLRSHYIAARFAAPLKIEQTSGLVGWQSGASSPQRRHVRGAPRVRPYRRLRLAAWPARILLFCALRSRPLLRL